MIFPIGQSDAAVLFSQPQDQIPNTCILSDGPPYTGKFSANLYWVHSLLQSDPFTHPDFMSYRIDHYSLKTRYFLSQLDIPALLCIQRYTWIRLLLHRARTSFMLEEMDKPKVAGMEFEAFEEEILEPTHYQALVNQPAVQTTLLEIASTLDKKRHIPIAFIRKLIQFHSSTSQSGKMRISLIGNLEYAGVESQSAMLRLLEEPPPNNLILMSTAQRTRILPTILSRVITVPFHPLSLEHTNQLLKPHQAASLLEWMEQASTPLTIEAQTLLKQFIQEDATQLQYSNALFELSDTLTKNPELSDRFFHECMQCLRACLLMRQSRIRRQDYSSFVPPAYQKIASHVATRKHSADISSMATHTLQSQQNLSRTGSSASLILPHFLIQFARWLF